MAWVRCRNEARPDRVFRSGRARHYGPGGSLRRSGGSWPITPTWALDQIGRTAPHDRIGQASTMRLIAQR